MLPLDHRAEVRRFGTFEVDLRARELRKGGIRIRLQEQPFEILAVMLDRPGEVVTREALRQRLWPAGTFVDFEHSLNAAIKRLRTALGDDADNPRFVETLHRRGYRFIASVESNERPARGFRPSSTRVRDEALQEVAGSRLVVLPFANLSNDPTQEYFSDGLTEEMITQIGRLCPGRLGVIARTSSMLFKRSGKSASEIGRELNVDYLLEGSVRSDGERIRITAQLIDLRTETHLWAETYDRCMEETLILQSDVAARIARSLALELVPDQRDALVSVGPRRSEAYQAYLKGRYQWRSGDDGLQAAVVYYDQAIDLDPEFAAAYAALARAKVSMANSARQQGRPALEGARDAARRAIDLDAGLGDAYLALAEIYKSLEWNWALAENAYRKAIALSPSCESAHRAFGVFLAAMSRTVEAKTETGRACDLDPLCLSVSTSAAWVSYAAGDYEDAIGRCQQALEIEPAFLQARRVLGVAFLAAGRPHQAVTELEAAAVLDADNPVTLAWLAHAKTVAGVRDEAAGLVARLEATAKQSYVPAYHLALAHVGLGNRDTAFALLERACLERDPALINLAIEPRFGPLRQDLRYEVLITQLAIPR